MGAYRGSPEGFKPYFEFLVRYRHCLFVCLTVKKGLIFIRIVSDIDYHVIIKLLSFDNHRMITIDQMMIHYWPTNKQTNKQTNMLNMMSMWLLCDYHKMIIVCSFNDHLMIFWLPNDDHNNYHHLVIKNWYVNHNQHVVINEWCVHHHHPHHHIWLIKDRCVNHHYNHNSNRHYLVIKDRCVNHMIIMWLS